jgi:hypothetical protein
VECDTASAAELGDFAHRLDDAGLVVDPVDRNQIGVGGESAFEVSRIDPAKFVDGQEDNLGPALL